MADSSSTAVLAFLASWFTPTSLFVFLNLVIGTIVVTTRFTIFAKHHRDSASARFARAPSLQDRVKSINFSHYYHYYTDPEYAHRVNPPQLGRPLSLLQRLKSVKFSPYRLEPGYTARVNENPEPEPDQGHQLARAPSFLERVKSIKLSLYWQDNNEHLENDSDPVHVEDLDHHHHVKRANSDTMPSGGKAPSKLPGKMKKSASHKSAFGHFAHEDDDAVELEEHIDAKADNFINRFRQQLKMQRLDSIMRYKEMLTRAHAIN